MPKPYDRVKNTNQQADVFIKTPYWTPEVEAAYALWRAETPVPSLDDAIDGYLGGGVAVSFKEMGGSICCTLAHQPSKESSLPYLLTGWSDNASDAMMVAEFKLLTMLRGIWQEPPQPPPSKRH